jgi:hypothetical protein
LKQTGFVSGSSRNSSDGQRSEVGREQLTVRSSFGKKKQPDEETLIDKKEDNDATIDFKS